jgi:hypothetical protein
MATTPAVTVPSKPLPIRYPRLDAREKSALLRKVVERSAPQKGAMAPSVIFDLDGTLLDNRPRTVVILKEFGAMLRAEGRATAVAERLLALRVDDLAYLVSHTMLTLLDSAKVHVDTVESQRLVAEADAFWKARFFIDDYMVHDTALPGAVAFARTCYAKGANIGYFTGRDLPNMSLGSWKSLRDLGFPIGTPGTSLIVKPNFDMPDEHYKRTFGPDLRRIGPVVAVFDNEPANCNVLLEQHPEAESIFLDTQHFPGAPALLPNVSVIDDFVLVD